jgi:hypothetical protein
MRIYKKGNFRIISFSLNLLLFLRCSDKKQVKYSSVNDIKFWLYLLIVAINYKIANQATSHVNQRAFIQNLKPVIISDWMAFNAS